MKHLTKFVAALLAIVLFGPSFLAVANCSAKLAMAGHCGGEHCPMMLHARQQANTQVSEAPSGKGSCCKVTTIPVATHEPATTPISQVTIEPNGIQAATVPAPVTSAPASAVRNDVLLAAAPSPQALLCTFLV